MSTDSKNEIFGIFNKNKKSAKADDAGSKPSKARSPRQRAVQKLKNDEWFERELMDNPELAHNYAGQKGVDFSSIKLFGFPMSAPLILKNLKKAFSSFKIVSDLKRRRSNDDPIIVVYRGPSSIMNMPSSVMIEHYESGSMSDKLDELK